MEIKHISTIMNSLIASSSGMMCGVSSIVSTLGSRWYANEGGGLKLCAKVSNIGSKRWRISIITALVRIFVHGNRWRWHSRLAG